MERVVLMEQTDGFGFGNGNRALIGGIFAHQQPEQGGFSAAVDPHDAQLVPVFQGEGYIGEDIPGADPIGERACTDGYHGFLSPV